MASDKLLRQFRLVAGERLKNISKHLMDLEASPTRETGRALLRELHSLKGEARMIGFADASKVIHAMEELLRAGEASGYVLGTGAGDVLLAAVDAVAAMTAEGSAKSVDASSVIAALMGQGQVQGQAQAQAEGAGGHRQEHTAASAASPPSSPSAEEAQASARVADDDGVVRIQRSSLDVLTTSLAALGQVARRRELSSRQFVALVGELGKIARVAEGLGAAGASIAARVNRVKETIAELHREGRLYSNQELRDLGRLSEEVQALRMQPLSVLFEPYPRQVRALAKELGKDVQLVVSGEANKAERSVLEALREPLMHLVQNALDHGIETPAERVALGKPARAKLRLRASREGESVLVRVEDDGRGIDLAAIRRAAARRGLYDEAAAAALSDAACRELIFEPGFSSREAVSHVSGRGVGLDVVRVKLQRLGGDVTVESRTGQGTAFELWAPVSLTVAPLLFLKVGGETVCLTAAHVVRALRVSSTQVQEIAGRPALRVKDEILPYASASSILGMSSEGPPEEGQLVLHVLEERVQAILPLKGVLSRFKHLAGATPLADGSVALVLSAAHLIATARGVSRVMPTHTPAVVERRRVLVVDDSPLTRELLISLLEAIGYEVIGAVDGAEALELLTHSAVELVVTDLEMPRMDGLELTRRIKSDPNLRRLPVVIVTTRGSEADRRRGVEAGADGYITKTDLVRHDLIDVVARLLV